MAEQVLAIAAQIVVACFEAAIRPATISKNARPCGAITLGSSGITIETGPSKSIIPGQKHRQRVTIKLGEVTIEKNNMP